MIWALAFVSLAAAVPAGLRWLRIAQREHYLPPAVSVFASRWWSSGPSNIVLLIVMLAGAAASWWNPWWGLLTVAAQIGPIGLGIRGRSSPLAWTARLRRVAIVTGVLVLLLIGTGAAAGLPGLISASLLLLPVLVDVALLALLPLERGLGNRWVDQAKARLVSSGARVVAVTGSYGKTTTKLYTAHLIGARFRTVASPASFNNRMGLARAINEHLVPGTEVFVAEMGTYGPGEIAELTTWIRPDVAAIVAIGPVHLERFRTEERIVTAKAEILDRARVGVISLDHPLLAALASGASPDLEVITVSAESSDARVRVADGSVSVDGRDLGPVPEGVFAVNLAVALGIGLGLGMTTEDLATRLEGLPVAEHRLSVTRSERGFTIIDDTFNSNPAGARAGLRLLSDHPGRKVVVTPGMVEMGPRQDDANRVLASEAAALADDLLVVRRTNRRALVEGSANGTASVTVVGSRQEAVDWVRDNLGPADTVLYENDLPDHYP